MVRKEKSVTKGNMDGRGKQRKGRTGWKMEME